MNKIAKFRSHDEMFLDDLKPFKNLDNLITHCYAHGISKIMTTMPILGKLIKGRKFTSEELSAGGGCPCLAYRGIIIPAVSEVIFQEEMAKEVQDPEVEQVQVKENN